MTAREAKSLGDGEVHFGLWVIEGSPALSELPVERGPLERVIDDMIREAREERERNR